MFEKNDEILPVCAPAADSSPPKSVGELPKCHKPDASVTEELYDDSELYDERGNSALDISEDAMRVYEEALADGSLSHLIADSKL